MSRRKKIVAGGIVYVGYLVLMHLWNPDFVIYHNTFTYLVLIGWMVHLFVVNWFMGKSIDRALGRVEEMQDRAIRYYVLSQHGRVRTEPAVGHTLNAFCACSAPLGTFHKDQPDVLLELAAVHVKDMVAKEEEVKRGGAV